MPEEGLSRLQQINLMMLQLCFSLYFPLCLLPTQGVKAVSLDCSLSPGHKKPEIPFFVETDLNNGKVTLEPFLSSLSVSAAVVTGISLVHPLGTTYKARNSL